MRDVTVKPLPGIADCKAIAPSLPHLMEMKRRVVADSVGHCRFYHAHQTAFFEIVLSSLKHDLSSNLLESVHF